MIKSSNPKMERAQSALEYAMVISVVIAALLTMHFYVQRCVQGKLQLIDEQVEANLPR